MESWGAIARAQSQRYEAGGLMLLVVVRRVRLRSVKLSV